MHILHKFITRLLIVSLLFTNSSMALAQDEIPEADSGKSIYLPLIDASKQVASIEISAAEQQAALVFWSREAIAAAKPMALMAQIGPVEKAAQDMDLGNSNGPAGSSPSGRAAANADSIARAAYAQDWAMLEGDLSAAAVDSPDSGDVASGSSQTYTSYVVNQISSMQTLYPHRWIGRLSFRTPSGTSYCSGTSISGNVMLTAAHCLYDTTNNRWYSNWVFTPAYRNGSAPYGSFAAQQCWVLTAWVNLSGSYSISSWARHDVGVCKMGNNSSGQTMNNAVGWMGRTWNASYISHFHNLGYPFRNYNNNLLPNAGLYLRTCVAESFQYTTETLGMGCDLGGGISGGPWMVSYTPGVVTGWADSVNSGGFVGTRNIYGARFNSNNIVPLCNAAAC